LTPCAYIDELTAEPFRVDAAGLLEIPAKPGLGVEIDPDKLRRFCPHRITFQ
jgi:L-alanine-DL-glutamate epimerase-like enolase superfamily enzyme